MFQIFTLGVFTLLLSLSSLAQIETNSVAPQFMDQRIERIPEKIDDVKTEKLLREMTKKAGWFPEITLQVNHGIVVIEGKTKDQNQLSWLVKTAEKLPTVIAVVNKADIIVPPLTDMSPFFKELKRISNLIKKNLPRVGMGIILGALFIFLGVKIFKYFKIFWMGRISNVFLATTVSRLLMLPVWLTFFYLCLMVVGLQGLAGTIIGGTGVIGIVLGFAFKGIAENYLSGLLLAIRSPFTKGDVVRIDNSEGIVQNLNMRGTTLMDFDGNLLLIPNITVIQSVVKNMSVNKDKRTTFVIGVDFTSSIKDCQDLVLEALKSITGISTSPAPLIYVENMGSATINIRVYFWFNSRDCSEANLKSAAIVKTKELLLANGIQIPDTSREMVFVDPIKVQMLQDATEARAEQKEREDNLKARAQDNLKNVQDLAPVEDNHEEELRKLSREVSLPMQQGGENLLTKH